MPSSAEVGKCLGIVSSAILQELHARLSNLAFRLVPPRPAKRRPWTGLRAVRSYEHESKRLIDTTRKVIIEEKSRKRINSDGEVALAAPGLT